MIKESVTCLKSSERGFTLIEAMVSVIILATGLIGLISMFETSFRANASGRNTTIANRLMATHLEELRAISFDSVSTLILNDADYSDKSLTSSRTFSDNDTYTVVATYNESGAAPGRTPFRLEVKRIKGYPFAGIDKILVAASWTDRFGNHTVSGITYLENF